MTVRWFGLCRLLVAAMMAAVALSGCGSDSDPVGSDENTSDVDAVFGDVYQDVPEGDADYPLRWAQIKAGFSRNMPPGEPLTPSRIVNVGMARLLSFARPPEDLPPVRPVRPVAGPSVGWAPPGLEATLLAGIVYGDQPVPVM